MPDTALRRAACRRYSGNFKEFDPSGVNLGPCSFTLGERELQFIAFDAPYLEKLKSGDARTEEHFVSYFSELIRLKLRSRLNSREAIEDVRQETFVRVLSQLRGEKGPREAEKLGAYVNSICNHVLLEHYRSRSRNESGLEEQAETTFVDRKPDALSVLERKDTQRVVRQILDELPERDRSLLRSVLLEDRDKDEVCAELGVSRDYLRVLVHRAKQAFKAFYLSKLGEQRPY
jgi:RNA polymerase sigma-70 factor, ECF subfamily